MPFDHVQSLVLRPARGKSVAHLLLRVAPGGGGAALAELKELLQTTPLTVGADSAATSSVQCTLGFSYRGLEALCTPAPYLRVFSRLSPAFAQGAPLRSAQLGDTGASAPAHWLQAFRPDNAHVLLTLHGPAPEVDRLGQGLSGKWRTKPTPNPGLECMELLRGDRLGAPSGQQGEWVHFGYRDGETDHHITGVKSDSSRSTEHAPGEFLLGYPNDSGFNTFGLPLAPREVREFFASSSFGVLRPMRQDVSLFQQAVEAWRQQAEGAAGRPVTADWVKAKLCGRWPTGEAIRPGQSRPDKPEDTQLDFKRDPHGTGCPWSAHVRRMNPQGQGDAHQRDRPLVRRGTPFGPANWNAVNDGDERGLYGFFFCSSVEDQFEHLLGQWANRRPLGAPDDSRASDPLGGQHEFENDAMLVPQTAGPPLAFTGFKPWTQSLGTVFAWHPSKEGVERILNQEYVSPDDEGPWL